MVLGHEAAHRTPPSHRRSLRSRTRSYTPSDSDRYSRRSSGERGRGRSRSRSRSRSTPRTRTSRSSYTRSYTRSRSRSYSRSDSGSYSRSRSRTRYGTSSRSRSRSWSRSRSQSRSRSRSRSRSSPPPSCKIVIEKLTKNVSKAHIEEIFSCYGVLKYIDMPMNHHFGVNRGLCYVTYERPADAALAMDSMHEGQLDGVAVTVAPIVERRRPSHRTPSYSPVDSRRYGRASRGSTGRGGRFVANAHGRGGFSNRGKDSQRNGRTGYATSRSRSRSYTRSRSPRRRSRSWSRSRSRARR